VFTSLLLSLLACDFNASTKVQGSDTGAFLGSDAPDDGASDEDGGPDLTDDTGEADAPPPEQVDDDEDGYTEENGDCDDDNDAIAPGLDDVCDGIDNDCDDEIDEDADPDGYEPNDSIDFPLGNLEHSIELVAFLDSEDDVDRYSFVYSDSWVDFDGLSVALRGLDGSVTYKMKIINQETGEEVFEDFNAADEESIEFTLESSWGSDSGQFEVILSSLGGGGCMTEYRLEIVHSDWWK
jgi:hypothetical protein